MNRHELVDVGTIMLSSVLLRNSKFFSRSIESPPIGEVVAGTQVPALGSAGFAEGRVRSIPVETPVGSYEAAYLPWQWRGPDHPTLLYHHGSGEQPFDFGRFSANSFRRLFDTSDKSFPGNVVALRAPFHDHSSRAYARSMGALGNFVGMLASSTALVEALRRRLDDAAGSLVVSGISLGGWVTNLHRAFHGSADRYAPIFAGAALGEMFVSSVYRRMSGSRARDHPQRLRSVLDFEEAFRGVAAPECSPLLARYDRIIEFDRQKAAYAGMDVSVLEKGHVTGSLATGPIRGWLIEQVTETA